MFINPIMPSRTVAPEDIAKRLMRIPPGGYCDVFAGSYSEPESLIPWASRCFGDIVLGKMMGSAYEWFYKKNNGVSGYRFWRLLRPYPSDCGILASVEPDRLDHYEGVPGRYVRKNDKSVWYNQEDVPIDKRIYYSIEALEEDFYEGIRPHSIVNVPVFPDVSCKISVGAMPDQAFKVTQYEVREYWHGPRFGPVYFYRLVRR